MQNYCTIPSQSLLELTMKSHNSHKHSLSPLNVHTKHCKQRMDKSKKAFASAHSK